MFTLTISCLITSNLPWFMDLTFQVPMQYCFLQHRTLLLSQVTSTTGYCFALAASLHSFCSFFLHWSPVVYWSPTNLGSSSFSVPSSCLFIVFRASQGKNTEVVCHSLLQWTTFCQNSPPVWKGKKIGHWKMNSSGQKVPNILLEISGEITQERMKGWSLSKNNTQLWMWLVIEARFDAVKSNIA